MGGDRLSPTKEFPSSAQRSREGPTLPFLQPSPAPRRSLRPTNDRLPRQSLSAWKHVLPLRFAAAGARSTEPWGCKLVRNNYLCQSPFLSRGQTKGTPPCSPPRGEVCGGNRETHHCDRGSSAEFPTLGSGGGGWAGARAAKERLTERERLRFSERPRRRDKPRGRISVSARSQGTGWVGAGRGGGAGVEVAVA